MAEHQQKSERVGSEALEQLLARRDEFLRFLERRVDSRAAAEDILQSAFVRGIEKVSAVRDEESAVAWFYRLLRNAVVDHYRSRDSASRRFEEWPEGLDLPDKPVEFVKNEICRCVNRVVEELKPEYSEALRIVDIEEQPISALAKRSGITANNASVRVHRAREALKKQVRIVCGSCAEHRCVDCRCKHP
jgi:RNA polymerase sigma factor (sigma-70 family)